MYIMQGKKILHLAKPKEENTVPIVQVNCICTPVEVVQAQNGHSLFTFSYIVT